MANSWAFISQEEVRQYENEFSLDERIKENSTYEIVENAAKKYANQTALAFAPFGDPLGDPLEFTYHELCEWVNKTANFFLNCGIQANDAITYLLPNIPENNWIFLAAQTVAIANPLNPLFSVEHLTELMNTAETKLLIAMSPETNPFWANIEAAAQRCPSIKQIIFVGPIKDNFRELLEQQSPQFTPPSIAKNKICAYFATSGTTDNPKLAMHTQRSLLYMTGLLGRYAKYDLPNTVVGLGMPGFHPAGCLFGGLSAFQFGAKVFMPSPLGWMDSKVISEIWNWVLKYQVTSVVGMPFSFNNWIQQTPPPNSNLKIIRSAISGNPVTKEVFDKFETLTGAKIDSLWGQTENILGTFNPGTTSNDKNFGEMGFACPYQWQKVVKLDANNNFIRECKTGEWGFLLTQGPSIVGYKNFELNKQAFINIHSENWFNTGDIVQQHADGCFSFIGRNVDFIYYNGEQVSLLEIEKTLRQHPAVMDAVAIAPSSYDADPVAFVELKNNTQISEAELMQWYCENSEGIFHPKKIVICNGKLTIPRNHMTKPLKYVLKEMYVKHEVKT